MKTQNKLAYFFAFISLLIMNSCHHYIVNENGYIRPPEGFKFRYENKTQKLENNLVVDTTSIYVSEKNFFYADSAGTIEKYFLRDNYIRFFSNGRFKQGTLKKLEEFPEDMNDIKTGGIGYYILKDSSVYLEFYSDIEAGSSQLKYAEINKEGNLEIYSENPYSSFGINKFSLYYNPNQIKKSNFELYEKRKNQNIESIIPNW